MIVFKSELVVSGPNMLVGRLRPVLKQVLWKQEVHCLATHELCGSRDAGRNNLGGVALE